MKLQIKNNYLLLLCLLFLSACSSTISQEIFEDGKSTIEITILDFNQNSSLCQTFEEQIEFFDESCTIQGNTLNIKGSYYLTSEELQVEKGLFSSLYQYDLSNLETKLISLTTFMYGEIDQELEDVSFSVTMPGSLQEHSFLEENNNILFDIQTYQQTRTKIITSKIYHIVPILIFFGILVLFCLLGAILYRKRNGVLHSNKETKYQEVSQEELKCKQYILQFKSQYDKEVLYQGLVNSGIEKEKAKYYVNKYFI